MNSQATILKDLVDGQRELVEAIGDLTAHQYEMHSKLVGLAEDVWGMTVDFDNLKEYTYAGFSVMNDRFDGVDDRLDTVDNRLDRVDDRLDRILKVVEPLQKP